MPASSAYCLMSPVRLQLIAQHHGLLPRRLRSLHRAPAGTRQPPPGRAHDEPLERLFVEERRRMKIISTTFWEKPVLKLMFAAMNQAFER